MICSWPSSLRTDCSSIPTPSCHWQEVAITISGLCGCGAGFIAAHFDNVGASCIGFAFGVPLLGCALIHRLCGSKSQRPLDDLENVPYGYLDPIYSRKLRATEKMCDSLRYAVEEGQNAVKKNFSVKLDQCINSLIDVKVDDSSHGAAASENWACRRIMEDVHFVQTLSFNQGAVQAKLAVVCDGHGDFGFVGESLEEQLGNALEKKLQAFDDTTIANTLTRLMVSFDGQLRHPSGGTTLTAALIFDHQIFVFNVGDSRTILCKKDTVYQLTEDAKPHNLRFAKAILEKGFDILNGRIFGTGPNVARDIGWDILSPRPKITRILRGSEEDDLDEMTLYCPNGSYLVLACDGLWDVASTQEVQQAVWQMDEKNLPPGKMAAHLVKGALLNRSTDNITVVVVKVE